MVMEHITVGKTTINVDIELRDALKRMGKMGETYNDVLRRLVEKEQRREKK
jgi:predicted CopG family antitoxin